LSSVSISTGCHARHQIVLGGGHELLLQHVDHIHGCHDVGDVAVHLKACRLMARGLADDDCLDEVPHDRHQPLLDRFASVVAREEDQLADRNLDVCRIELRLQLLDLPLKILGRLLARQKFSGELFALYLKFVELVVEDGKPWPAFGMPVLNLLG